MRGDGAKIRRPIYLFHASHDASAMSESHTARQRREEGTQKIETGDRRETVQAVLFLSSIVLIELFLSEASLCKFLAIFYLILGYQLCFLHKDLLLPLGFSTSSDSMSTPTDQPRYKLVFTVPPDSVDVCKSAIFAKGKSISLTRLPLMFLDSTLSNETKRQPVRIQSRLVSVHLFTLPSPINKPIHSPLPF